LGKEFFDPLFFEEFALLETIELNLLDDLGFFGFLFADPDTSLPV